jgi:hypothetical protein
MNNEITANGTRVKEGEDEKIKICFQTRIKTRQINTKGHELHNILRSATLSTFIYLLYLCGTSAQTREMRNSGWNTSKRTTKWESGHRE